MLEIYVIACLAGTNICHDHTFGIVSKEEMTPHKCGKESVEQYRVQKFPAYPNYKIKKYGCRKPKR